MILLMANHVKGLGEDESDSSKLRQNLPHQRQKRLIWITTDGRLAMPPGTSLIISPTLSLPFIRYPPEGFMSNMTISLPFTSQCLFSNELFYGVLRPVTWVVYVVHVSEKSQV